MVDTLSASLNPEQSAALATAISDGVVSPEEATASGLTQEQAAALNEALATAVLDQATATTAKDDADTAWGNAARQGQDENVRAELVEQLGLQPTSN